MKLQGLTTAQVAERIARGDVNEDKIIPVTNKSIIKKHTITLFNIVCFTLALICIFSGQYKNALFIAIAVINAIIAIVNDIRAKNMVEKLTLISEKHAIVLRDDKEVEISNDSIVIDDIIRYRSGDQIIVDGVLLDGYLEVNESFVTGESDTIRKKPKDKLTSGSFVTAGSCYAKVTAVGASSMINQILTSAKTIKEDRSELFTIMQNIVKYISFALVPIGIFLFINQLSQANGDAGVAISSTVSALISMIPEGLLLLTSSVLALATIRLAKQKVLVSDLYSIETLAKVDTICLDKTGTITTGNLVVERVVPVDGHSVSDIKSAISAIIGHLDDNNSTYRALEAKFGKDKSSMPTSLTPFSSDRKFSGVTFEKYGYFMGAYEFLTTNKSHQEQEQSLATENRVITVLKRTEKRDEILGFVLLRDEIRKNAKKIIKYFNENDVKVKIISGDNLATITKICSEVNQNSTKSIDLSTLATKDWQKIVEEYDIFARVRPEEKRYLIQALEKNHHTVAMTGDGVNDVLALRESDCGISIGSASDAARRVSHLVLLDDDFGSIPSIIQEGRRTINNITRSSTLFLSKTIYAAVLSVAFIFMPFVYPFTPIEMALLNFVTIGAPSFLLALEPNFERKKTSFFRNILKHSLPTAVSVVLSIIVLSIIADGINLTGSELYTFSAFVVFPICMLLIFRISRPLNLLRRLLLLGLSLAFLVVYLVPFLRDFYGLAILPLSHYLILFLLMSAAVVVFIIVAKLTDKILSRVK